MPRKDAIITGIKKRPKPRMVAMVRGDSQSHSLK